MDKPFIFLCKLAWDARFRIPLIITVAFMAFDIRMHLDINVQMRRIPRRRLHPGIMDDGASSEDDEDEDSWVTMDGDDDSVEELEV
ncbi:PREDICTED: uncharacterized protein LOC108569343 [Nicrophorus vespilloides]|uniref:Uncharacterized protein LOC108569343 n=1 Tax=Nicrophorus vespilloides TaxID=110193 RepID=A0ABM1NHP4_NICVS|nr:PREDICTED: uncharacterized protein LOC108569343 [Nicrophorus vespilloides]